ncbi:MAG: cation:proton antiporter [Bacteroidetes bacterium]|nr:cation:proton antiporter [Bacteroidota bacterium]
MSKFSHNDLIILLTSISVILIFARIVGEMGRKFKFPIVMGEIIVGVLLGPTIIGAISPDFFVRVFPKDGNVSIAFDGLVNLSVVLLLFVAGMEVQLSLVLKQGKTAIYTSFFSMLIPFATGFASAYYFPQWFGNNPDSGGDIFFSMFIGTALAISALPVIARILMDMNLFKSDIGMLIIATAMFNDLIGWLIFAFLLAMKSTEESLGVGYTILYIFGFGLFMLTIGKKIIDRSLPWIQTKLSWPGGVLSISIGVCMLCAAFTEKINLHAILGAFIAGIAFGDSVHLHEKAREIIHQFVTNFFAPLFFVSIGLRVNFIDNFDAMIVGVVLVLAYFGKVIGATFGAYLGGVKIKNAIAVGFGLNARGAMEILLGTLALSAGLISQKVFVALIIMALVTSITSAPMIRKFYVEKGK